MRRMASGSPWSGATGRQTSGERERPGSRPVDRTTEEDAVDHVDVGADGRSEQAGDPSLADTGSDDGVGDDQHGDDVSGA